MHVPEKIEPTKLADYLEIMTKSVFQSGISWRVVESKWPGVREAMRGFDPDTIAGLSAPELDELAQDSRMIRHRRKLLRHHRQRPPHAGTRSGARRLPGLSPLPRRLRRNPASRPQGLQVHGRFGNLPLPLDRRRRSPALRGMVRHPRAEAPVAEMLGPIKRLSLKSGLPSGISSFGD